MRKDNPPVSIDSYAARRIPPRSLAIFLAAVFFVFASFGFAGDVTDMGLQSRAHFAISVVCSGIFAVCYAASGILLRGRFWKVFVPLFVVQITFMTFLSNWLPNAPRPAQLDAAATANLQLRLVFDGLAIIVSVCLGYIGFVYVSISEGRRHGRAQMDKAMLESEMAAAREVQRVMVPADLPQITGYAIESVYLPAAEVGGDFFQVIPLASGRTLVVLGDVSGKGLRAAMIVSMIVGTLRTVSSFSEEPAGILSELNRKLFGRIQDGFATCVAVRLGEAGRITVANAGHIPPYLNGTEVPFPGSLPLGMDETAAYAQQGLEMAIGDAIVLLTDGIAEAQDSERVLLGFSRVESMLRKGATAKNVAEAAELQGQNDDITVLRMARLA